MRSVMSKSVVGMTPNSTRYFIKVKMFTKKLNIHPSFSDCGLPKCCPIIRNGPGSANTRNDPHV